MAEDTTTSGQDEQQAPKKEPMKSTETRYSKMLEDAGTKAIRDQNITGMDDKMTERAYKVAQVICGDARSLFAAGLDAKPTFDANDFERALGHAIIAIANAREDIAKRPDYEDIRKEQSEANRADLKDALMGALHKIFSGMGVDANVSEVSPDEAKYILERLKGGDAADNLSPDLLAAMGIDPAAKPN